MLPKNNVFTSHCTIDPIENVNKDLFNACNPGCPEDKYYFTYPDRVPPYYRLKGDLTIDNTNNYLHFIKLDNGLTFDGCGHTITLTSSVPANNFEGLFGSNGTIVDGANVSISNVTIKVDTEHVTLVDFDGWLCYYVLTDGASNVCCVIDNCHVCAVLNGDSQGGFFGNGGFDGAIDSIFTIQNCSFRGNINGTSCGGIIGSYSFDNNKNTIITINNCSVIGDISGRYNGGITSTYSFNTNQQTTITIQECHFTGTINGFDCGGITDGNENGYESFSYNDNTKIAIQDCSFSGKIYGFYNSGIIGGYTFINNINDTTITIQNCCATGDMTGDFHAGIVGYYSFAQYFIPIGTAVPNIIITIQNCHYVGNMVGNDNGGVVGNGCFYYQNVDGRSGQISPDIITIQNCSSLGNILGSSNSGIVGTYSFENTTAIITIRNNSFSGDVSAFEDDDENGGITGAYNFFAATADSIIEIYNCLVSSMTKY